MLQVSGALPEGRTAIFQKMFRLWCFDDSSESTVYHITPKSPKGVQLSLGLVSHPQPFNESWMEASAFVMSHHSFIHVFPWIDALSVFMSQDDIDSNKNHLLNKRPQGIYWFILCNKGRKHVTMLHSLRQNLSYSGDIVFNQLISSFQELRTTSSFIQHNRNVISRH